MRNEMNPDKHCTAVVLAGGRGTRMGAKVQKQYILLQGKPLLYYPLRVFEDSFIEDIILVTGAGQEEYCRQEIVEKYGFKKVRRIVAGGSERYHSVHNGIQACGPCDYFFIHDGARPFMDADILRRGYEAVQKYDACVVAMPVKDTIKIADAHGFAKETPNRSSVWMMQTPQIFSYALIKKAYEQLIEKEADLIDKGVQITDDAMVVETFSAQKIKLTEGSYANIKVTTPDDLAAAEIFLKKMKK